LNAHSLICHCRLLLRGQLRADSRRMARGGGASNPFALFVRIMKMRGNKCSGGSAAPWKGTDCGTFGGLHQFCAEFVSPGSCLSCLGLGGENEALFFFATALALRAAMMNFVPQSPWPLHPSRPSARLGAEFWWCRELWHKLDEGQGGRESCIPVVLQAGRNCPEKYP
jgi:hypothetical protein